MKNPIIYIATTCLILAFSGCSSLENEFASAETWAASPAGQAIIGDAEASLADIYAAWVAAGSPMTRYHAAVAVNPSAEPTLTGVLETKYHIRASRATWIVKDWETKYNASHAAP